MKKTIKNERKNRTNIIEIEQNTVETTVADVCIVSLIILGIQALVGFWYRCVKLVNQ